MLLAVLMLIRILAVAAVLGASACVADDGPVIEPSPDGFDPATEAPEYQDFVGELSAVVPPDRLLCQANGPCSPECDSALILELFVPPNACVVFTCTIDGESVLRGGCNPGA